jgi:hypothetical protein
MRKTKNNLIAGLEALEPRRLMSAGITVEEVGIANGTQLLITGSANDDSIVVTQTADGLLVTNFGETVGVYDGNYRNIKLLTGLGNDRLEVHNSVTIDAIFHAGKGRDTLIGGKGDDRFHAGKGLNDMRGRGGDDVFVTIGGGKFDSVTGGMGVDSFWLDADSSEIITDLSSEEIGYGSEHRVSAFMSYNTGLFGGAGTAVSKEIEGQKLLDPKTTSTSMVYKDFSNRPLFSDAGPTADDVSQGQLGDCYFLATISSIADVNPYRIRNAIVDLGDGTYAVRFKSHNTETYVRVDGDLPTRYNYLSYAQEGAENSIWVAVMEKAWAFYRFKDGDYGSIEGGWMSEAYGALGAPATSVWSVGNGQQLLDRISAELEAGKSVTFAVDDAPYGTPLVSCHAYSVHSVGYDANGNRVLTLRNPWGVDGYSVRDGVNDGYVTLTAAEAFQAFWAIQFANV